MDRALEALPKDIFVFQVVHITSILLRIVMVIITVEIALLL